MNLLQNVVAPLAQPDARYVGIAGAMIADKDSEIGIFGSSGHPEQRLSTDSIFEIASLTKTFTGLLLCDFVSRGAVRLDDLAVDFLPESIDFTDALWKEIQLVHLASHTSGLPRLSPDWNQHERFIRSDPYSHVEEEDLLHSISITHLHAGPGDSFHYSNFGFGVLGYLLGRLHGQGYEAALTERILLPLGMNDTSISLSSHQASRLLAGHHGHRYEVPHWNFACMSGAGGIRSTITDMCKFLQTNILPQPPLEEAFRLQRIPRSIVQGQDWFVAKHEHVGLDWRISRRGGHEYFWHNGSSAGFGGFICFVPSRNVGVVFLANSSRDHTLSDAGVSILETLILRGSN